MAPPISAEFLENEQLVMVAESDWRLRAPPTFAEVSCWKLLSEMMRVLALAAVIDPPPKLAGSLLPALSLAHDPLSTPRWSATIHGGPRLPGAFAKMGPSKR